DRAAQPTEVDVRADLVDDTGHLTPRSHRQRGPWERPALDPAADRRVDDVHAGRLDGYAHLSRTGRRVEHLLVVELGRRAELVLTDRVHGATLGVEVNFRSTFGDQWRRGHLGAVGQLADLEVGEDVGRDPLELLQRRDGQGADLDVGVLGGAHGDE